MSDLSAAPVVRWTDLSARECWRRSRTWLRRRRRWIERRWKRRRDRFLLLQPPWVAQQRLFDRVTGTTSTLFVRDGEDLELLDQIFITLDYDFARLRRCEEIHAFYRRVVDEGRVPLIVDAGANIGLATRYFRQCFGAAHVIAVEPDAGNLALARANNPEPEVEFIAAGVGCSDMRGRLVDPGTGHCGYRIEPDPAGQVNVVSFDGVVRRAQGKGWVPFVAKIDIEGFEDELFADHTDWIDCFPVIIIELHDWMLPGSASSRRFLHAVSARDRDFVHIGENIFSLSNTLLVSKR